MATTNTIDLAGALAAATFVNADLNEITLNGTKLNALTDVVMSTDGTSITIPKVGVLTRNATGGVIFTANAVLAGDVTLTDGSVAASHFITVDFNKATEAVKLIGAAKATTITGGAGADTLTSTLANATIVGGAGNDVITAGDIANVTGGTGADTFVQTVSAKAFNVADYNYSQDSLKVNLALDAAAKLTAAGKFTNTNVAVTVDGVAADGAYKIKVANDADTTIKEFWTAKSADAVTLDASTNANNVVIDVTSAKKAVVTGSAQIDTFNLKDSQVTLVAGLTGGNDVVNNFDLGFTGDVLNLTGATLNDVTWSANAKLGVTTLTGVGSATNGKILVQENGGTAKKVSFTGVNDETITGLDADVYIGTGAKTTLDVNAVTVDGSMINLYDTTTYRNITDIKGATAASASYVGTAKDTDVNNFNLAAATKSSQVWGGSKGTDNVTLNIANQVQDVMWFGTNDGLDKVTGFKSGFAATADVVNLFNVSDLTNLTFDTNGATGVKITAATGNVLDVDATLVTDATQLLLKNQAGTVKKVAVGVNAGAKINGVGADMVIGKVGGTDSVIYDATQISNVRVNLFDTSVYKNIKDVNLTGATGAYNVVVGSSVAGTASDITLAGTATDVWGGNKLGNKITAGDSGTDTIWFGANDGADTVVGFTTAALAAGVKTADKVKFYDKSISDLAKSYAWSDDGTDGKFTATKTADTLTLKAVKDANTITVVDKDNKEAKMVLSNDATGLTYAADAKVYMGGGATTLTITGNDNTFLYLGNGVDMAEGNTYFSGVTKLNAVASTGKNVLIGSAAGSDVLTGGKTSNAMWGGGVAADTMVGSATAVDQFWFGTGDGRDSVNTVDKGDTVVLYNVASINDVAMTVNAGDFVITAKDGSSLTVTDATNTALDAGLTFQFGTGTSAKSYTYNKISKNFTAK